MIPIKPNPITWKKTLYIASFDTITYDDELNEIRTYKEPVEYEYNYQPVSSYLDIQEFGKDASIMQKMVLPISDKDLFKEYDLAYLNGVSPYNETTDEVYKENKIYYSKNGDKYKQLEAGTDYVIGDEIKKTIYNIEENYGDNANYVLLPPKEGNAVVIIYCQKIKGK